MIIEKHITSVLLYVFIALIFLLSGCAQKTTVVLLPDPDGKVGHITVSTDAGSTDITQARGATEVKGRDSLPTAPKILSEQEVAKKFSPVLAILPSQPVHFIFYFKVGSNDLTTASKLIIPEVLKSIENRKSQNISVVGHSDTAGDRKYNLQLSRKRASAIRLILIKKGVDAAHITSTSHGEENPVIKTADNVNEPRNRRVEVVVR